MIIKMETRILVRPVGQSQWLILNVDREIMKDNYGAFFNNDDPEQFYSKVDDLDMEVEVWEEADSENHDIITIEGDYGKEDIEVKLVKMSESDIVECGEFLGW